MIEERQELKMKSLLNDNWSFSLGEPKEFYPISIPHDWLIHDPRNWYKQGVGWYRRTLHTDFFREGTRVWLHFDGVFMDSALFVNGKAAGEWKYGFTAFEHEITDFLLPHEDNELLLRVNCQFPSSRWYTGAGIYRNISLIVKDTYHFINESIYITTHQKNGEWTYNVTARAETNGLPYELHHQLLEDDEVKPWSPEHPRLYTLRCELMVGGKIWDTIDTKIGFRQLGFDAVEGFSINGEKLKLNGVCLHQEFSILGAAVQPDMIRRQLNKLKEMGVNAVRPSHNPPSCVFMDLADEMGFLVISEFTDVWEMGKTTYDYSRFFKEWHERDIASWIKRDRNRPSVIMWSLGNEVPDTHANYRISSEIIEKLSHLVRLYDPLGQAPLTFGSNYMPWENTQRCAQLLGTVGYNYAEYLYNAHHLAHPNWIIYGSETCSTVQSRGVYHFPLRQPLLSDDDLQCSSLGNSTTSWGARSIEACIKDDKNAPFSLGQFVWTGQDYLGEPTPYHTKNSYFGMLDTAGFEKDAFYVFMAGWTAPSTNPFVHLFPYWDFSPGQRVDVRVCSNQAEVALYLDDELLGKRTMDDKITQDWIVPYRPGVLSAQGFDRQGKLTAQTMRASFGEAVTPSLAFEHYNELTFVTITALDGEGRAVENANRLVRINVQDGELIGLDNGDSTDLTPYTNRERRMFSGMLLAIIKNIRGKEPKVSVDFVNDDIPVRKIELSKEGFLIRAQLLPNDASYDDMQWRLTNAAGVDSNLGELKVDSDGRSATIIPKGDGEIFVRCGINNGLDHIALYSQISVEINGFGTPSLDPFSFVSAGLFSFQSGGLTNGNDRGVASPRDKEVFILYENLDFTKNAADQLKVWLFPLTQEPFHFQIWEGRPDKGGVLLCEPLYDLGMKWNEYQELNVRLPRKLKDKINLCFVFSLKTHFKGFIFQRDPPAYQLISASQVNEIYGDSFTIAGEEVLRIGNNTTLVFGQMNFISTGTNAIEIVWRSGKSNNAAQLLFQNENGRLRSMLNLSEAADWQTVILPLENTLKGCGKVSIVFLPGCAVDLASIRFIRADEVS